MKIEHGAETLPQRILMLNTAYRTGGAEHAAADLMEELRRRHIECYMFVGMGADPKLGLFSIPSRSRTVAAFLSRVGLLVESLIGRSSSNRYGKMLAQKAKNLSGRFEYPLFASKSTDYIGPIGSFRLLTPKEPLPDLVHAHNLHGVPRTYFDLRAVPALSARVPFVLSLHDCWTMAGHCSHSLECNRWQTGCGKCPDLGIYLPILKDRTAKNWREKQKIYRASKIYVHAVSDWVKQRAEKSILADGIRDLRVIHNGIDRSIFSPGAQATSRQRLNLPIGHRILAFVATQPTRNRFKDFDCLRSCLARLGTDKKFGRTLLVAIGGGSTSHERIGSAELVAWPYSPDRNRLADLFRAADIYLHAAKADTFPRAVLEALACGTPVIATAVGGIPEQIRSLDVPFRANVNSHSEETATGILVKAQDDAAMAAAVKLLSSNKGLLRKLGIHAAEDAEVRFDLQRQTDKMIAWYKEIIDDFKASGRQ